MGHRSMKEGSERVTAPSSGYSRHSHGVEGSIFWGAGSKAFGVLRLTKQLIEGAGAQSS